MSPITTVSVQDRAHFHKQLRIRLLVLAMLASGIIGYLLSFNAYSNLYSDGVLTVNSVLQNVGMTLIVLQLVLAYVLKNQFGGLYWFFWLQLKAINHPTEQQKADRRRVFERAYGTGLLISLIAAMHLIGLTEYNTEASSNLMPRFIWAVGICLLSLPTMLAAWRLDKK